MPLLPTSSTYNFQSIEVELLIREAFENIGVFGEFVEAQKLESARRSIDFLLLEWMSKSTNLWTLQIKYLSLNTSQAQYNLSSFINNVSDLIQVNLRSYTRQLTGTAQSSGGGVAANAFDGNPATACTQTVANGNISYDYGVGNTQQINFIGIESNQTLNYSLIIEYSQDLTTWIPLPVTTSVLPLADIPQQEYVYGNIQWFDILIPIQARAYRIRETGGLTLDIQEIYFNNNIYDLPLSEITRSEYYTYPNKQLQGRPNAYYIDRQISPNLFIWPVPSSAYNCIQCSYKRMIMDAGSFMKNTLDIPARFYPSIVLGLSWKLAIKFNPPAAEGFRTLYEAAFTLATVEDSENAPITIMPDSTYGYR